MLAADCWLHQRLQRVPSSRAPFSACTVAAARAPRARVAAARTPSTVGATGDRGRERPACPALLLALAVWLAGWLRRERRLETLEWVPPRAIYFTVREWLFSNPLRHPRKQRRQCEDKRTIGTRDGRAFNQACSVTSERAAPSPQQYALAARCEAASAARRARTNVTVEGDAPTLFPACGDGRHESFTP